MTVSRGGYLKRTAVDTYQRQLRGGKGRIGMGTRAEDVVGAPDHRVDARLPADFHHQGPAFVLQDLQHPRRRYHGQRQTLLGPDGVAAGTRPSRRSCR